MVLTLDELGAAYAGWSMDTTLSGEYSNERRIREDPDSADEEADQKRFGRLAAYTSAHAAPAGQAASPVRAVVTGSVLLDSPAHARGFLLDDIEDAVNGRSLRPNAGTVATTKKFKPEAMGGQSAGLLLCLEAASAPNGPSVCITTVGFAWSSLVGSVMVVSLGDAGRAEAGRLAKLLEQKMRLVVEQENR